MNNSKQVCQLNTVSVFNFFSQGWFFSVGYFAFAWKTEYGANFLKFLRVDPLT